MQISGSDIIALAKTFVDDDHEANDGWIAPSTWLRFANWELQSLYRRLVRGGHVHPATIDQSFAGHTASVTGVLAIVGVAQDMGSYPRILHPAQDTHGASPFWVGSSQSGGPSQHWKITGVGDNRTLELFPRDTATYVVRYVPAPAYLATAASLSFDIPTGSERSLAYGVAAQAMVKDQAQSGLLRALQTRAEEELGFHAGGSIQGSGPRVRNTRRHRTPITYPDYTGWTYL